MTAVTVGVLNDLVRGGPSRLSPNTKAPASARTLAGPLRPRTGTCLSMVTIWHWLAATHWPLSNLNAGKHCQSACIGLREGAAVWPASEDTPRWVCSCFRVWSAVSTVRCRLCLPAPVQCQADELEVRMRACVRSLIVASNCTKSIRSARLAGV
jgi:hypothetical protein